MQDKKIAFVFPGQGSQAVGMLSTLADEPIVRETLKEADEALGFALSKLIAEGPAEELSLTVNTQPALVCASIAMYRFYLQEENLFVLNSSLQYYFLTILFYHIFVF